jgi:hypothetical protein
MALYHQLVEPQFHCAYESDGNLNGKKSRSAVLHVQTVHYLASRAFSHGWGIAAAIITMGEHPDCSSIEATTAWRCMPR